MFRYTYKSEKRLPTISVYLWRIYYNIGTVITALAAPALTPWVNYSFIICTCSCKKLFLLRKSRVYFAPEEAVIFPYLLADTLSLHGISASFILWALCYICLVSILKIYSYDKKKCFVYIFRENNIRVRITIT